MFVFRGRTALAVLAVTGACIATAVAAVPAQARATKSDRLSVDVDVNVSVSIGNLLTPITSIVPGTGPASSLKDAFTRSPTNLVTALACPTVGAVGSATQTIPGVGEITNQLTAVVCALNILGYAYRTTYIPPSGPAQVRYFRAVAAVPAPLDVDGNGIPDFTGFLSPSVTPAGVGLTISRLGFPASAKVKIEAVLLNPATPNSYVGVGEDGTKVGTAGSWNASVGVFGISPTTTDLGLVVSTSNAPAELGILGEVFSGSDPDAPQNISRGNVNFAPVPSTLTTEVRLSDGRQEGIITSQQPSKVTGRVELIKPGDQKDVDLTIDKLPASIDVIHQTQGGHENTTYTASAAIDSLTAAYHDRAGAAIETAAALDATGVPAAIAVDQFDGKTAVGATTGAFGSVEARFAKGGEVPAPGAGTGPYVAFHRESTSKLSGGVRLTKLKSVAFDASGPYSGQLIFSEPLPPLQLSAQDDVSGITATGNLTGMPMDTIVTADVPNGVFSYDGHGQGISQIHLHATKASGTFFTRASRLDATIDNLPSANTFNVKQEDGKVGVAATNPVGTITLLASDGSDAPAVSGSYAWYEDTPARYRAFARISDLTGLSFQGDPLAGSIDSALPQVLNLHGEVGGITADGAIDKLPAHVGFSLTPTAGGGQVIDYNSNGAVIDKITLHGSGLPSPVGGGGFFNAEIDDLPSHLTLTVPSGGGQIKLDTYGAYITRVLAQLWGNEGPANALPGHQLLHYGQPDQQITADLHNVGGFALTPGTEPLFLQYDISHDPLDFGVNLNGGTFLGGTISNPQPATVTVDASLGIRAFYKVNQGGPNFTGEGQIDGIDVTTNAAGGYLEGHLANIPAELLLCVQPEAGTLCKPTFVPTQTVADGDTYNVPPPDFAFQLLPKNLSGGVPANSLTFNGRFCPSEPDPATCLDNGAEKERIVINDLKFNTVEAAFAHQDDGCTVACGRGFGAFNTNNDPITGHVALYADGEDDPDVDFDADDPDGTGPDPGSFVAANEKFFFLHYDAVSTDPVDTSSSGTITCGSPKPSLEVEIPGFNPDLLGGTFGVCP